MAAINNGAVLRRFIEDIDSKGDVEALSQYVHDDVALPADTSQMGLIPEPATVES